MKTVETIAFYIREPIKINQGFIYNQITRLEKYRSVVISFYPSSGNVNYPFEQFYNLNDIPDLHAFFKDQNIVAIHAHQGKHALDILPLAKKFRIPLIVHFRGRDASTQTLDRFRKNVIRYQDLVKHGSLFFAVCDFLAGELIKLGFPERKIHVLYGGIDLDLYPYTKVTIPKKGDIRIVSVARLVEKKGFFTLLRAFERIKDKHPRVSLHIIGTGEDEEKIKSYIIEKNLQERVFLHGAMHSNQIAVELKKSHLFCLPSETGEDGDVEGIPNALKEAMASGLPVISTVHGGIPELIEHKRTGYLCPEKDDVAIAKGIEYFLNHPKVWNKYTKNAREVIEEKFDLKKQMKEQERLYRFIHSPEEVNKHE